LTGEVHNSVLKSLAIRLFKMRQMRGAGKNQA